MRRMLAIFVFLIIYDGVFRKWIFPQYEQQIFILKDLLLTAAIAFAVLTTRVLTPRVDFLPLAKVTFVLYAGWVLAQAFNVNLPTLLVGLWGIKIHLLYAGVVVIAAQAYRSPEQLIRATERAYPWIVMLPCLLAFIQLGFPAESLINQQVRGGIEHISHFGESALVRVTGTFSFSTGMALFVQSTVIIGTGLFLTGARSKGFLISLGLAMAAMPVTGSRGVVVVIAVSILLSLFAGTLSKLVDLRAMFSFLGVLGVLLVITMAFQKDVWLALLERSLQVAQNMNDHERIWTAFTSAFDYFAVGGLFGYGSGATDYGSLALTPDLAPFSWLPAELYFETENGRLALELGAIGWLFSFTMRFVMCWWALSLCRKGRSPGVRAAGLLAFPFMVQGLYLGNGVFAPPFWGAIYWFSIALMAIARNSERVIGRASLRYGGVAQLSMQGEPPGAIDEHDRELQMRTGTEPRS